MRDFKKCDITYLLRKIDLEMLPHLKIASGSFIYYVINVYVPRVRANAYHMLTTPPRVFRDPKMCLRNIWTAPKCESTSTNFQPGEGSSKDFLRDCEIFANLPPLELAPR